MITPAHSVTDREERSPAPLRWMPLYLPVVWMMGWVIRAVFNIRRADVPAAAPPVQESRDNRQLRRAKAACLRRLRAHASKGRRFDRARYIPKAYGYAPYMAAIPRDITKGQFLARLAFLTGWGRARVFGFTAAHHITACGREPNPDQAALGYVGASNFSGPAYLIAGTDPAPP